MRRSYKYRLYPTRKQRTKLECALEECRWFYNFCLEHKRDEWENNRKSVSLYDLHALLPGLKIERSSLRSPYAQSLQQVAVRVDLAYKAFFRRVKSGETPGYPRFKGRDRYDSITYPQATAFRLVDDKHIRLAKIGHVRLKYHRPIEGTPKSCTVSRSATGKWYVTISCEDVPKHLLRATGKSVGIDVGLESFATLSDGTSIANPRFFKHEQRALAREQRRLSRLEKGTAQRKRQRRRVARVYERIAFRRHDFVCQEANKVIQKNDVIAVEDLSIKSMLKRGCYPRLSRSIADASWGLFLQRLSVKAEDAGRTVVRVNPAYTSQDCSSCGTRTKHSLDQRTYVCPHCHLELNRDLNAALNILAVGTHSLAQA